MRVIDHAQLIGPGGETSTVTLAVTVPWFRGQPVYHVFHRAGRVLTFHRSYTRADVIGWPNERRPGRYRHPDPAAAALEDFRVTVEALRSAAALDADVPAPWAAVDGFTQSSPLERSGPPSADPLGRERGNSVA